jgi:CIC family chloride channel protein
MVGMGAMVGGGTGAAMTAVTMIFEMTLDYHIVLPMILAVAAGLGVRRALSRENIYTAKLVAAATRSPRRCTPTCSCGFGREQPEDLPALI